MPEVSGLWRTPSSALGLQCGFWPEKRAKAPVLRKVNKMLVSKTLPVQIQNCIYTRQVRVLFQSFPFSIPTQVTKPTATNPDKMPHWLQNLWKRSTEGSTERSIPMSTERSTRRQGKRVMHPEEPPFGVAPAAVSPTFGPYQPSYIHQRHHNGHLYRRYQLASLSGTHYNQRNRYHHQRQYLLYSRPIK